MLRSTKGRKRHLFSPFLSLPRDLSRLTVLEIVAANMTSLFILLGVSGFYYSPNGQINDIGLPAK